MADIVFIALIVAFFGLCALYIRACDHILSGGEDATSDVPAEVQR